MARRIRPFLSRGIYLLLTTPPANSLWTPQELREPCACPLVTSDAYFLYLLRVAQPREFRCPHVPSSQIWHVSGHSMAYTSLCPLAPVLTWAHWV